jgi:septal ring factor EnvC (AmiA/AmiB activator)
MSSARPDQHVYGTTIRTAKNENVLAVTRGTILSAERMADNTFSIVLQSGSFIAVYRHVSKVLKAQGVVVEKGESIGLMDGEHDLEIELWDEGQFVDFEEKIVF